MVGAGVLSTHLILVALVGLVVPVVEDHVAAFLEGQEIGTDRIVLMGESLGSGVAVELATAERFAALVPGAAIAVIPEAGHLPMIEREEAFLDAVRPFLAD